MGNLLLYEWMGFEIYSVLCKITLSSSLVRIWKSMQLNRIVL